MAEDDTDETRAERQAKELRAHLDEHLDAVKRIHEQHPTPAVKFTRMTREEQIRFRSKQEGLIKANKKYTQNIKRTCAQHRDDNAKLAREIAERPPVEEARILPPPLPAAEEHQA